MHSLGYKYGYSLPDPQFVNPVNKVMLYAQQVIIMIKIEDTFDSQNNVLLTNLIEASRISKF